MLKLLVIESDVEYYQHYFFRIIRELIPADKLQITHAPSMLEACKQVALPWEIIFINESLGSPVKFYDAIIRNGKDILSLRRRLEALGKVPKARGICATSIAMSVNRAMIAHGADLSFRKDGVLQMADYLNGSIRKQQRRL